MVRPSDRSRSLRKMFVKTPGGRTVKHLKRKKPSIAKCGKCRAMLAGIPRLRPFKMRNLGKSKKRPERPYGGILCSSCMRKLFVDKARKIS